MLLLSSLLIAAPTPASPDATTFMAKVLEHDAMGFSGTAEVDLKLTIRSPRGTLSRRRLQIISATLEGRQHTLVRFLAPAELSGTGMLLRDEPDGSSTQLMYQPSYDKIRPIAASNRSDRFMGTDFSYSDLEGADSGDSKHRFLADAKCGKATCKQVESRPDSKRVQSTGYGRIISLIHPKALVPMRTRFFGRDGKTALKVLTVKKLKKVDGRWMVTKAVMKDLKRGSATQMEMLKLDRNKSFSAEHFTEKALRSP
ncbi:MAG: hypothetical protein CMH55_06840 [Myxococcales bacterium]|nr:hypothetical protein [Myxococcales bacterium]